MKKLIFIRFVAFAVILSAILTLCFTSVSASDTLVIKASEAEGKRGDEVEIALTVESNPGFMAMLMILPKAEGFEIVKVTNGNVMRQMTQGANLLWDAASNSTATGTLVTVTIKIGDRAPAGDNYLDFRIYECFNSDQKSVDCSISSVKITVLGEPLDTQPQESGPRETENVYESESVKIEETQIDTDDVEKNTHTPDGSVATEAIGTQDENGGTTDTEKNPENGSVDENVSDKVEDLPIETDPKNDGDDDSKATTKEDTENDDSDEITTCSDSAESNEENQKKSGCGSSIASGALTAVVTLGFAVFSRKKKND